MFRLYVLYHAYISMTIFSFGSDLNLTLLKIYFFQNEKMNLLILLKIQFHHELVCDIIYINKQRHLKLSFSTKINSCYSILHLTEI